MDGDPGQRQRASRRRISDMLIGTSWLIAGAFGAVVTMVMNGIGIEPDHAYSVGWFAFAASWVGIIAYARRLRRLPVTPADVQ